MWLLAIILVIVLSECVAQYFIRKYTEVPLIVYFIMGVLFYTVVAWMLHKSYQQAPMGLANTLWSGFSIIAILTVGALAFGDKIELHEWIGMTIILVGVAITQFPFGS